MEVGETTFSAEDVEEARRLADKVIREELGNQEGLDEATKEKARVLIDITRAAEALAEEERKRRA